MDEINKFAVEIILSCADFQFHYVDSKIPLLHKSEISSLYPSSVAVQPEFCQTWSETPKQILTRRGSFILSVEILVSTIFVDRLVCLACVSFCGFSSLSCRWVDLSVVCDHNYNVFV